MNSESRTIKDLPGESYLVDLQEAFDESYQGLKAFYKLINSDDYDDLCIVFKVLLDRSEVDLERINEVITAHLGVIEIEVARELTRRNGQLYHKGDFMRASIIPGKETASVQEGGGA